MSWSGLPTPEPAPKPPAEPRFFATPAELRTWFEANHASATELQLGMFRKSTGRPSVTWPEAVDQALCFGWIDGVRHTIDDTSFMTRFTPRRPRSMWSAVNLRRVAELTELGLMRPEGLAIHAKRDPATGDGYSYERLQAVLDPDLQARFETNSAAWQFFQSQPPGYRRVAIWYVMNAKRAETRQRRLDALIDASGRSERLAQTQPPTRR